MLTAYDNHPALVEELSAHIIEKLDQAIKKDGVASIAFSGGGTPKLLFQHLAKQSFDWSKVQITLVDERCVDISDSRSNAKLITENLLNELSSQPTFFPLYVGGELGDEVISKTKSSTQSLKLPLDIAILGMGGDGHTASFFPDSSNIKTMLDVSSTESLMTTQSESSVELRITWSLSTLLQTDWLALHIVGASKQTVFEQAVKDNDPLALPISAVIEQQQSPLSVFYTPE